MVCGTGVTRYTCCMKDARPSLSAPAPAEGRALHQLVDAEPLVFRDPYAVSILGEEAALKSRSKPSMLDSLYAKPIRAWMVVRARIAEDILAAAVREYGAVQYLVLGAGLDTFALRNYYPGVRVFEVDHPATQAWKRERLEAAGLEWPRTAELVPVNFDQDSLRQKLLATGFDFRQPTVTAWLGVTAYLSPSAFSSILQVLSKFCPGSDVVFDYVHSSNAASLLDRLIYRIVAAQVARMGEPFQLFLTPESLRDDLKRDGFTITEDLGTEELNPRYFMQRSDGLHLRGTMLRLCHARVG